MLTLERHDSRGDPVLWVGLAACGGALVTVAPVIAILVAALVVLSLLGLSLRAGSKSRVGGGTPTIPGRRVVAVAFVVAFALGAFRAEHAIASHERARNAILADDLWPARCTVVGTIVRSPLVTGDRLRVEVDAHDVRCRDGPVKVTAAAAGRTTLYVPLDSSSSGFDAHVVGRGDLVSATASIAPPYRFWNDGTGDPRPTSARRNILLSGGADDMVVVVREAWGLRAFIDRVRGRIRQRIMATFPRETSAMARALVLGEDDLAEEDHRAFRQSGLAHLLAVSGMHLVLVVMGVVAAIRALLRRIPAIAADARFDSMRIASAVGLPLAWIYADLAGGSGSAVRAAWMCSVVLLARVLGRRSEAWRALGLSLIAMSAFDPLVVFDVSFVLSALATAGILGLARPIEEGVTARLRLLPIPIPIRIPALVIKPFATTAAATIACAPVLAMMAPELPMGGLIANVVAVPIGEAAALPLCLLHGLLFLWPAAESGCAMAASGALTLVRLVARAFVWGGLPIPSPTAGQLGAIAFSVASSVLFGRPRAARGQAAVASPRAQSRRALGVGVVLVVVLEVGARFEGSPHATLRVTFLDVGQGDSALIDLPDGSAMLIDGGGLVGSPLDVGERAVAPLLAARRRSTLDVVVLSHPHPDHFLGLTSALSRVRVKAFWDTGQGETEGVAGHYADLVSSFRHNGVPVLRPIDLCGSREMGGAVIDILAPCPGAVSDRGANDNSFVIRIRYGERAILFVGDAERDEEAELLARFGGASGIRADVLKVGHHGSRTSSTDAFLAAVAPRVAVISCRVRNRFGHPHEQTLDAFRRTGARVLRTDRDGSVVVTTDGHSLDVRTMMASSSSSLSLSSIRSVR